MINLKNTYIFRPPNNLEIIVIGAGGTGGFVIRDLTRFLASYNNDESMDISLTIIDHDIIEIKNLVRQNFVEQDLGKYKAEVLAERYSSAFGLEISSIIEKFDISIFDKIIKKRKTYLEKPILLIGCVDNNEARRQIFKCIKNNSDYWGGGQIIAWIDAGNEKASGQVIMGSPGSYCTSYLPFITDLYPEILDRSQDPIDNISCAERAQQNVQNIFVNLTAANNILNFINIILNKRRTMTHGVEFNITGKTNPIFIKKESRPDQIYRENNSIWNKIIKY